MIKNVPIYGLSTSPSDDICRDGELAMCENGAIRNGEIVPVPGDTLVAVTGGTEEEDYEDAIGDLVYIHKVSEDDNYIFHDRWDKKLLYVPKSAIPLNKIMTSGMDGAVDLEEYDSKNPPSKVVSIGNMLIVGRKDKSYYYRWIGTGYVYLGQGLPDLPPLQFGLHTLSVGSQYGAIYKKEYPTLRNLTRFSTTVQAEVEVSGVAMSGKTTQDAETLYKESMALVAQNHRNASSAGAFTAPFFVRYCFRLYDGRITKVSPPVLMIPNSESPIVSAAVLSDGIQLSTSQLVSFLRHRVPMQQDLSEWTEIITSVDIFVSSPIYNYRQDLTQDEHDTWLAKQTPSQATMRPPRMFMQQISGYPKLRTYYGCLDNPGRHIGSTPQDPKLNDDGTLDAVSFGKETETASAPSGSTTGGFDGDDSYRGQFVFAMYSPAEISAMYSNVGAFYYAGSIPLSAFREYDDRKFYRTPIKELDNLETHEPLVEDYLSNYDVNANDLFVYNNRLMKADCARDYTTSFQFSNMTQYVSENRGVRYLTWVKLLKNGIQYTVPMRQDERGTKANTEASFIFYPDPDAYEMVIGYGWPMTYKRIPLKRHELLQGAYWSSADYSENFSYNVDDWQETSDSNITNSANDPTNVPMQSMVYISEVNNPFLFPSGYSTSVGQGKVLSLAVATKAMSEGQFGEHPVYAFTDEGIWAINVTDEGKLYSKQPVSRHICTNVGGIVSTDDAIVFPTVNGIMYMQGSEVVNISESLRGVMEDLGEIPHLSQMITSSAISGNTYALTSLVRSGTNIIERINKYCIGCYDPTNRRVYYYDSCMAIPGDQIRARLFAFVYDINNRSWFMCIRRPAERIINVYPQSLMVEYGGNVYDVGNEDTANKKPIMLLTRPIKFGDTATLKSIRACVVRGKFQKGAVKIALYGSSDGYNWTYISSSMDHYIRGYKGSAYRYVRVLIMAGTRLNPGDAITGIDFDVVPKLNNRLR